MSFVLTIVRRLIITIGLVFLVVPLSQSSRDEHYVGDATNETSLLGNYLASRYAIRNHQREAAASRFGAVIADLEERAIYEKGIKIMLLANKVDEAKNLSRTYLDNFDAPGFAHLMIAASLVKEKKHAELLTFLTPVYKNLDESFDAIHSVTIGSMMAWAQLANGQKPEAFKTLQKMAHPALKTFLRYQKAMMHQYSQETKKAETLFDEMMEMPSQSYLAVDSALRFYDAAHLSEKRDAVLADFAAEHKDFEMVPSSTYLRPQADLLTTSISVLMLELGQYLSNLHLYDNAESYFRIVLMQQPTLDIAHLLLANLLDKQTQFEKANVHYMAVKEGSPFYRKARYNAGLNLARVGRVNESEHVFSFLASHEPENYYPYMYLADIFLHDKQFGKAEHYYTKAIERVKELKTQHWALFYGRGITRERQDKWEQAEPDFLKSLSLSPAQPDALNYLAYSWLVMGQKTGKALEMLSRAVAQRPNDAHIIDSYGWALYLLGRYEEALSYIEAANNVLPHDATTNDHLGDVFWKLGRKREAKFQWKRALTLNPEDDVIQKLKYKIEHGLKEYQPETMAKSSQPKAATQPLSPAR